MEKSYKIIKLADGKIGVTYPSGEYTPTGKEIYVHFVFDKISDVLEDVVLYFKEKDESIKIV